MSKETQQDAEAEADEHECALVYHVRRKRRLRGFLPLYVLLSALLLGVLLWLVPIRMPEDELPGRIGRVYYRDDRLMQFHLMQRSPLPFALPDGVDPAAELMGRLDVPLSRPAALMGMEPLPMYGASGDSCVLDGVDLLALPPEELSPVAGAAASPGGAVPSSPSGADGSNSAMRDAAVPAGEFGAQDAPVDSASAAEAGDALGASQNAPASKSEPGIRSTKEAPHHPKSADEAVGDTESPAWPGEEVQP